MDRYDNDARDEASEMAKFDFDKQLKELKELEAKAEASGLEIDKTQAKIFRGTLMSYKGMTRELEVFAMSQGEAFRKRVLEVVDKKDVEEIHRLWSMHCEKK